MNFKEFATHMAGQNIQLTKAKNHDYAGTSDVYSNFKYCSRMGISTTDGFLTRMGDKVSRIKNFKGILKVSSEKITDTISDLANYCMLLCGYMQDRQDLAIWAAEFYRDVILYTDVEQGQSNEDIIKSIENHMLSASIFIKRGQLNAAKQSLQKMANYSLQLAYATETMDLTRH